MSQPANAFLSFLVYGYVGEFQRKNALFHNFDNVLINICISYCINALKSDSFERIKIISVFRFGYVWESRKLDTNKSYAIKWWNKQQLADEDAIHLAMTERNILSLMDSPFVTSLKYAFTDDKYGYVVSDFMNAGNLKIHLHTNGVFSEDKTKFHAAEILLGLEHIHSKGMIFRDLKLENILLDTCGHCKISDFSLAIQMENNQKVRGYAGTPGYVSPQAILGWKYDTSTDFFSLGVLLFRCLSNTKPFDQRRHNNSAALDRNTIETEPVFYSNFFEPDARNIIKGLLHKKVENRLGYHGILEIKQHAWFDSIDFEMVKNSKLVTPIVEQIEEDLQQHCDYELCEDYIEVSTEIDELFVGFEFPQNIQISVPGGFYLWEAECFKPGDIAKIYNLKNSCRFNGEIAEVVGYYLDDTQRWPVQIISTDEKLAIKTKHLKLVTIKTNNKCEYYDRFQSDEYDRFELNICFILSKWIKLISIINIVPFDAGHYNYMFETDCIALIRMFLGQCLTFYDEIFKLCEVSDSHVDNLKGIKYVSNEWILKLYITDNKCEYQNYEGNWNIDGDELSVEYINNDGNVFTTTFHVCGLNDAEKKQYDSDADVCFEHIFQN